MRITFITPFTTLAGGTRVIATYARMLHDRGHDVTVVSAPQPKVGLRRRLKALAGRAPLPVPKKKTPLLDFLGEKHRFAADSEEIRAAEVPDADVVIATWWKTAEWVARFPASKGRKFYLLQDYEVFNARFAERIVATYALDLQKIAVSSYIRTAISEAHPPQSDIAVVPNAVDTEQFDAPPRGRGAVFRVGFVYSHEPRKTAGLAIDALSRVRAQHPGIEAVCFGRDALGEGVLPDWITYHHAPAQAMIPEIYRSCDLWLFPTKHEGFGLPILEAMACRTPVLATGAGAAPDLIDGTNGEIAPHDPEAFAAGILRFQALPEADWLAASEAAYRTARQNRWEDATDRLLKVLEGGR